MSVHVQQLQVRAWFGSHVWWPLPNQVRILTISSHVKQLRSVGNLGQPKIWVTEVQWSVLGYIRSDFRFHLVVLQFLVKNCLRQKAALWHLKVVFGQNKIVKKKKSKIDFLIEASKHHDTISSLIIVMQQAFLAHGHGLCDKGKNNCFTYFTKKVRSR